MSTLTAAGGRARDVRTVMSGPKQGTDFEVTVPTTANVLLGTRDAQSLYAKFGFVDVATRPPRGFDTTEMVLAR